MMKRFFNNIFRNLSLILFNRKMSNIMSAKTLKFLKFFWEQHVGKYFMTKIPKSEEFFISMAEFLFRFLNLESKDHPTLTSEGAVN
mmetsp:Transcript_6695/g.5824  ORF Transcript_6695/g.5824 Transcript_6695/m.5824 type:complete len:86 (+) Transcript_6695:140-397(+)